MNKKCIFCAGSNLSKEHFWPNWMGSFFERTDHDKNVREVYESKEKQPHLPKKKINRPGRIISKKLRVVCASCNNGWMSNLEEKVKPTLLSILEKKALLLDRESMSNLSKWITMKVFIAEQSEPETQLTSEEELYLFKKNLEIPNYLRIYIGRHNIICNSAYYRQSCTLGKSKEDFDHCLATGTHRNTHAIVFLVGQLLVYVFGSRSINFGVVKTFSFSSLYPIFPSAPFEIQWNQLKPLNQNEISKITYALDDFIRSPQVKT